MKLLANKLKKYWPYLLIIIFAHVIQSAALLTLPSYTSRMVDTGIQNSGLGLVLLFNPKIFPPEMAIGGMLFVTAWWGIWHIISGLSVSFLFSRWHKD